jgi:hypothetical protein
MKRIQKPKKLVQIQQVVSSSSKQSKAIREREKINNLMTFDTVQYSKQTAFATFLFLHTVNLFIKEDNYRL